MTRYCRHRRLEATCPICSRRRAAAEETTRSRPAGEPRRARAAAPRRRPAPAGDVRVRRLARVADDGFRSGLVPGIRATADAARLAREAAIAAARLDALRRGPAAPGAYGEAARLAAAGELEEALWLVALVGVLQPLEGEADPFAEVRRVRVSWSSRVVPALEGVRTGPRATGDPATLPAYRAWAARAGSQGAALAGEPGWTPTRRFDRAFERLALPGLPRGPRYDLLVTVGALGLADLAPASLHLLADPRDATLAAAKRVFGIGDPLLVQRRASALAEAAALPAAALDLGLLNWARTGAEGEAARITAGVPAAPDPAAETRLREALAVGAAQDGEARAG